jgi:DNA primase
MMQVNELKEYLLNNELCEDVLTALGCGHVRNRGEYISAQNPDGNNKQAITLYLNENLNCIDYTRQISKTKRATDIFDLVAYFKQCTFAESMKWVCDTVGLDYYHEPDDVPESLKILRFLREMSNDGNDEDNRSVVPIPEEILNYYLPYPNKMFENDGISLDIQQELGYGYDPQTNRITIPIRTPIGDLCGVKGRLLGEPDEYNPKYVYIEPTVKSKILYGLYENKNYIKNSNQLLIFEAEKSVAQCASNGIRNCVAIGGKSISKTQMELIIRTGCAPIVALDKGISVDEIKSVSSVFPENIPVYYIYDKDNILLDKQSPSDDFEKFRYLFGNNIYELRR